MRSRRLYDALLLPGGAVMLALFLIPLGMLIVFSFGTVDLVGTPQPGTTLDNYREVIQPYFLPVLTRTVIFAAITTVLCLLIGYPLAYFAALFAGRWGGLIIGFLVLTWLVDYLVRIYAWRALLADGGIVNDVLGWFGLGPAHMLGTDGAVVLGLVYSYFPLMALPIYAALGDLDRSLIEAGKDLYGSPARTFWHVTLPATRAGVLGGVLLVFLPTLGDFATAQFLGGPESSMIGNLIASQFTDAGSAVFGSALTVVLLVLLLLGIGLAALVSRGSLSRAVRGGT